jgi:hypothetical protein
VIERMPPELFVVEAEVVVMANKTYTADKIIIGGEVIPVQDGDECHERACVRVKGVPQHDAGKVLRVDLMLAAVAGAESIWGGVDRI